MSEMMSPVEGGRGEGEVTIAVTHQATKQLADHAAEIRKIGKRVVEDVVEIGRRLTICKDLAGHGNWLSWLDGEFGWKDTTALNFMRVYEMSKSANFADLSIPVSGLYLVAAPSTPEAARREVTEQAKSGPVSHQQVRKTINRHKSKDTSSRQAPPKKLHISTEARAALDELCRNVGSEVLVFGKTELEKGNRRHLLAAWQRLQPAAQSFVAAAARRLRCDHHLVDLVGPLPPPALDEGCEATEPELPFKPAESAPEPVEETVSSDDDALAAPDAAPTPNVDAAPSIAPVEATPPPNSVRKEALWLYGRLQEFESGLLDKAPQEIMAALTPPIREEIRTLAPKVATWLGQIGALS